MRLQYTLATWFACIINVSVTCQRGLPVSSDNGFTVKTVNGHIRVILYDFVTRRLATAALSAAFYRPTTGF